MRYTQKNLTGFIVLFLDVSLDCFLQRLIARFITLNDFRTAFIDGYDVVVFVEEPTPAPFQRKGRKVKCVDW